MNTIIDVQERIIPMKQRLSILLTLVFTMIVGVPVLAQEEGMFVLSNVSENFEVVVKYPHTEIQKEMKLLIYLSNYATNVPIGDAEFEFEITGLDSVKPKIAKTDLAGVYHAEFTLPDNKPYDALLTISSGQIVELIPIRGIQAGMTLKNGSQGPTQGGESGILGKLLVGAIGILILGAIAFVFFHFGKRSVAHQDVNRYEPVYESQSSKQQSIEQPFETSAKAKEVL